MSQNIENKTDIEQKNFIFFIVVMLAIAQFVIIGVLVVQINNQGKEQERNKKNYINKYLVTFKMLPEEIKNLYMIKKSTSTLDKASMQDTSFDDLGSQNESVQYIGEDKIIFLSQITCKDMFLGSYKVTQACYNSIEEFFKDKNENMVFEVVALVQSNDLIDLGRVANMLMQDDYKKYYIDKDIINNFTQYMKDGLAQNRVSQGVIQIRSNIGEQAKIRFNSFHKFSNGESGFTIKAYNVL